MRTAIRVITLAALASTAGAIAALTLATPGVAGQPVTQTLVPPPQPWQTCKAVGERTICEGTIEFSYGPFDTGLVCGSGPAAFRVLDSATEQENARRFYDEDGKLVRRFRHVQWTSGQLSNSVTGATLPYTQNQTTVDDLAVPGQLSSATATLTGEFDAHAQGGAPVVIGAGRAVFAPDGSVVFQAGPTGFLDLLSGDSAVVDRVCQALGAP